MADHSTAVHPDLLYPLSMFRLTRGIPKLKYENIEGGDVPQPYLDLLVHSGDMTSRLEEFHGGRIKVCKLSSSSDGRAYFREVVLNTVAEGRVVEYGAIEIDLSNLPEEIREEILAAERPLGGILNDHRLSYSSAPRAFLKVSADAAIREALGLDESADVLYGRSNAITGFNGESYARIVEILPPASVPVG
jgi:chorismate-pyruvate lyase